MKLPGIGKQILAWLLGFSLCLFLPASALADECAENATQPDCGVQMEALAPCAGTNPLYEGILEESAVTVDSSEVSDSCLLLNTPSAEELSAFSLTRQEAGESIREAFRNRDNPVTVRIKCTDATEEDFSSSTSTSAYIKSLLNEVLDYAFTHTGNPTYGDYMRWQYNSWLAKTNKYVYEDTIYLSIQLTITYFTTAEQEQQTTAACDDILNWLEVSDDTEITDYEKVRRIYNWICNHVTYDSENVSDSTNLICHSAYAAAVSQCAVCQGYSLLFYRLCLSGGVDARLIAGSAGGAHGWNIVRLWDQYYNVDTTWDAGSTTYAWFLKGDSFSNHTRYSDYTTDEFQQAYPMAASAKSDLCSDGHCLTVKEAIEPTYLKAGCTEGRACHFCGTVLSTSSVIPKLILAGDVDGNGVLTDDDAIHLLYHYMWPEEYSIQQDGDFDGSGTLDDDDAIYLLYYYFAPDEFPLMNQKQS